MITKENELARQLQPGSKFVKANQWSSLWYRWLIYPVTRPRCHRSRPVRTYPCRRVSIIFQHVNNGKPALSRCKLQHAVCAPELLKVQNRSCPSNAKLRNNLMSYNLSWVLFYKYSFAVKRRGEAALFNKRIFSRYYF